MAAIPPAIHHRLAAQHGHVGREQLLAELTPNQIQHLVRRGDLVDAGRLVYRSPSVAVTEIGRCVALCLGRPGLTIAGPTAGRLWGFRKMNADRRIHVLMKPHANSVSPATLGGSVAIVARRTEYLRPDDVERRADGIRLTSRPRTCLDLARVLRPDDLLSVIEQAALDGALAEADMMSPAVHLPQRNADRRRYLRQLDRRLAGGSPESDGEVRLGVVLAAHGLHGLVRQHEISVTGFGTIRFDLALPSLRWAVELDLLPTHQHTVGAAADRRRDVAASSAGWVVRRVTPEMFERRFASTVGDLCADAAERRRAVTGVG